MSAPDERDIVCESRCLYRHKRKQERCTHFGSNRESFWTGSRVDREIKPEAEKIGSRLAFCIIDENIAGLDRPITFLRSSLQRSTVFQ